MYHFKLTMHFMNGVTKTLSSNLILQMAEPKQTAV